MVEEYREEEHLEGRILLRIFYSGFVKYQIAYSMGGEAIQLITIPSGERAEQEKNQALEKLLILDNQRTMTQDSPSVPLKALFEEYEK